MVSGGLEPFIQDHFSHTPWGITPSTGTPPPGAQLHPGHTSPQGHASTLTSGLPVYVPEALVLPSGMSGRKLLLRITGWLREAAVHRAICLAPDTWAPRGVTVSRSWTLDETRLLNAAEERGGRLITISEEGRGGQAPPSRTQAVIHSLLAQFVCFCGTCSSRPSLAKP
ncbi:hypothetical protein E2C01_005750 [Portunus trituberculatus]|uniref:Uncharacterized protein n=1 Tax=Portunus trituberculatus TaxID=210409 RepID=A0A5B7CTH7_PORTR|nr:hypothetical protein [Portunus trituberculatus]